MTFYYTGKATALTTWEPIDVGFVARNLIISGHNENSVDVLFSWNGSDIAGHIAPGEPLTMNGVTFRTIWIKSTVASQQYRTWAWI